MLYAHYAEKTDRMADVRITIVYDNNTHGARGEAAWGFSCLVEGLAKTILFDTGGEGTVLLRNMQSLGFDPTSIDLIFLSHIHGDHTGGMWNILDLRVKPVVCVPSSFPVRFKKDAEQRGVRLLEVSGPTAVCDGAYSTGELGSAMREQSLVIQEKRGLVVITGCAHPGILAITRSIQNSFKEPILLLLGGFHLYESRKSDHEMVVAGLKEAGVHFVVPCHCTGDAARAIFQKGFGKSYIEGGVGRTILPRTLE